MSTAEMTIVNGFLDGDIWPGTLKVRGPVRRIAVVTETFNPNVPGSFGIQSKLISDLCQRTCEGLVCEISFNGEEPALWIWNDEKFSERLSDDLFNCVFAKSGDDVRIQIEGIRWYKAGGQNPYHDSATLEFYCPEKDQQRLLSLIVKFLNEQNYEVVQTEGASTPRQSGWFKTLVSKLFS